MLKALGNVMPRHLLDTRLNPSGELRDSVALPPRGRRRDSWHPDSRSQPPLDVRAVVQRVTEARVRVGDRVTGEIARGLLVLLGVGRDDDADGRAVRRGQDPRPPRCSKASGARAWTAPSPTSAARCSSSRSSRSTATSARDGVRRSTAPRAPERARALYEEVVSELRAAQRAGGHRRVPGDDARRAGQRRPGHDPHRQQAACRARAP